MEILTSAPDERFLNGDPPGSGETFRRLAERCGRPEVPDSRGEELTWSATSSAWFIRAPCPIAPKVKTVLLLRLERKMLRCRRLLRPTIPCALTELRHLWTDAGKHATWTMRVAVREGAGSFKGLEKQ